MSKTTMFLTTALAALALVASGFGLYTLGMQRGSSGVTASPRAQAPGAAEGTEATLRQMKAGLKAGDVDPVTGKTILYYEDPMAPGKRFDKPGKSPFMDMMLVPVYAGSAAETGGVSVSPRMQQSLGLRSAEVEESPLTSTLSALGSVTYNEREQAVVQARATGYVEKLYVRATLDPVRAGQPLADLYVPEWVAAQDEFLAVRRMTGPDTAPLLDGARQRMRQAGMNEDQIRHVEATGHTQPRLAVTAPIAGVVAELGVRQGMTVMPGATLFRINGLSTVWVEAAVPESQAGLLQPGSLVQANTPAWPGTRFEGKVQALLPAVDAATRTFKARMELRNPGQRLVPGMFVTMQLSAPTSRRGLSVPSDAVIQTGRRAVVMVAEDAGHFRPVEVRVGAENNGRTEILEGLQRGQKVVLSSQFLVDSEASLRGLEARLNDAAVPAAAPPPASPASQAANPAEHHATGKVESVDADEVTISHGAVPELQWPAMTMGFKRPASGLPVGVSVGARVQFDFVIGPDNDARLTRIEPMADGRAGHGSQP